MNSPMNTIIPWLEHLNVLMPPRNIALVGAGNGKGIWAQWLVHQASKSKVTLIEAEPLQYSILQRTLDLLGERAQHCEIRNTVVAAQQGTASFFVANSQQESGLLEPRSLLSLWPNLQTQEVKELSAITLDTLLENPNEEVELSNGEGHWLVIDCLPAGLLLQASSKLDLVDVVIARVLLGERHAVPDGTSLEEVAELLQQKGMVQTAVEATRHPGIAYALFVRDARAALHTHHTECQKLRLIGEEQAKLLREFQAQAGQLTQTKAAAEKRSQELAEQLEQLGQALEKQSRLAQERLSQTEQLTQAKLIVETQLQERVQQLVKERDAQAKSATECQAQIEQLMQAKAVAEKQVLQKREAQEKQIKELQQQNSLEERISKVLVNQIDLAAKAQLEAFSKILSSRDSVTKEDLQKIISASEAKVKSELGKGLANSVKQLESFMNIQGFFFNGEFFSDFHGWPISPDIGNFLLEKIMLNNYELIIEFGSGTSTAIFAKAAEVLSGKVKEGHSQKYLEVEVLTFEHSKHFHDKTQKMLLARNLAANVNLMHTPLAKWEDENQDYLYYDCQPALDMLAEKYKDHKIKILMLVDGPPSMTCKNARYPAVPLIFNKFANQSIDIVLDDANRPEEKATIELWRSFFKSRSVKIQESSIPSEKGIYYARIVGE